MSPQRVPSPRIKVTGCRRAEPARPRRRVTLRRVVRARLRAAEDRRTSWSRRERALCLSSPTAREIKRQPKSQEGPCH